MRKQKFNGAMEYTPDYSCEEVDFEVAKKLFEDAKHVSPVVDMTIGEDRVVLMTARVRRGEREELLLLIGGDGERMYMKPEQEVPESKTDFASAFLETAIGHHTKKSNLWVEAKRFSNRRENVADHVC